VWVQPEDQRIVGECLAAARVGSGMTQRDLADRLGKPQSFVSAYETGQRRVDVQEFIAITQALRIGPAQGASRSPRPTRASLRNPFHR
jgi:transcriptional regulator with XRE-family HTH domain